MKRRCLAALAMAVALMVGVNAAPVKVMAEENVSEATYASQEIEEEKVSIIKYEDRLVKVVYDGESHGLYAGVYNVAGEQIGEATLVYYGKEADGTPYLSTEKPVNAGVYQVTANYPGDGFYYPAASDPSALLIIKKVPEAIVEIGSVTTVLGSDEEVTFSYTTTNVVEKDIDTILSEMWCDGADDTVGVHPIDGAVNPETAKNYEKVTVIPGTHTIIAPEDPDDPTVDPDDPTVDPDDPTVDPDDPTVDPDDPAVDPEDPAVDPDDPAVDPDDPAADPEDPAEEPTNDSDKTPNKQDSSAGTVKTGDAAPIFMSVMAMLVSLAAIVTVLFTRKRAR